MTAPEGRGIPLLTRGAQKIFWTFSLEMAHFVQIPLYILTEMLGYSLLGPRQLLYIAGGWRGPLTGEGSGDGAVTLSRKFCDFFHLKWIILVQIPLYILT